MRERRCQPEPDRSRWRRGFAAFGELFVDDVLFGVGLVEIFVVLFGFIEIVEIVEGGIVDGVLFFEVVLSSSSSTVSPERVIWSMDISRIMVPRSAAPSRVSSSSKSSISSMELAWRVVL